MIGELFPQTAEELCIAIQKLKTQLEEEKYSDNWEQLAEEMADKEARLRLLNLNNENNSKNQD